MTLNVKHGKFRLVLWYPNAFLGFAVKSFLKYDKHTKCIKADRKTISQIVNCLRQAKKIYGKLELVSVNTPDGTRVRIVL